MDICTLHEQQEVNGVITEEEEKEEEPVAAKLGKTAAQKARLARVGSGAEEEEEEEEEEEPVAAKLGKTAAQKAALARVKSEGAKEKHIHFFIQGKGPTYRVLTHAAHGKKYAEGDRAQQEPRHHGEVP